MRLNPDALRRENERLQDEVTRMGEVIATDAAKIARLEAEVARLTADLNDRDEAHRRILAEECAPDERHCSCVPALRAEVARLRAALEQIATPSSGVGIVMLMEARRVAQAALEGKP